MISARFPTREQATRTGWEMEIAEFSDLAA
jgi:hypothetical protein